MNDFLGYSRYSALSRPSKPTNWLTDDTEALFDKHQSNKATKLQLKKLGWTKDSIQYKFNEHGFRSDSFSSTTGAMCLGTVEIFLCFPFFFVLFRILYHLLPFCDHLASDSRKPYDISY